MRKFRQIEEKHIDQVCRHREDLNRTLIEIMLSIIIQQVRIHPERARVDRFVETNLHTKQQYRLLLSIIFESRKRKPTVTNPNRI